jgi:hypothetical protein
MPGTTTKKFTPEIDAQLYEEMVAVAKQNGQPQRYVLERALEFYLQNVGSIPSAGPSGSTRGFPPLQRAVCEVARETGRHEVNGRSVSTSR